LAADQRESLAFLSLGECARSDHTVAGIIRDRLEQLLAQADSINSATDSQKVKFALYQGGRAAEKAEDYRLAAVAYDRVIQLDPDKNTPTYADDYARALVLDKRIPYARSWFEAVTEQYPKSAMLNYRLGAFLDTLGDTLAALTQFRRCSRTPDLGENCSWEAGQVLIGLARYEESLREFREVLRYDSTAVGAWNNAGLVLHELGRPSEAERYFRNGLIYSPHDTLMWSNLAAALYSQEKYSAATAAWERALREDPAWFDTHQAEREKWERSIRFSGAMAPAPLPARKLPRERRSPAQRSEDANQTSSSSGPYATGSGVGVSSSGLVVTNLHVVRSCSEIRTGTSTSQLRTATLVASDRNNDLALLASGHATSAFASLRLAPPIRAGDEVIALGFPLHGLLSERGSVTSGTITALSGLGDDARVFQISVPVQPGNSGGPLLDHSGRVVGVVSSKLDAAIAFRMTGSLPENVNFAIKSSVLATFLEAHGVAMPQQGSEQTRSVADVAEMAWPFTYLVECWR
jgi:S1-C subfamily serine protease